LFSDTRPVLFPPAFIPFALASYVRRIVHPDSRFSSLFFRFLFDRTTSSFSFRFLFSSAQHTPFFSLFVFSESRRSVFLILLPPHLLCAPADANRKTAAFPFSTRPPIPGDFSVALQALGLLYIFPPPYIPLALTFALFRDFTIFGAIFWLFALSPPRGLRHLAAGD